MNEYDSGSGDRPQKHTLHRNLEDKIQYLLGAEEQLLQSISARAPLPEVLNGICSALDRQVGNVISLILLPEDDPTDLVPTALNAAFFGLYAFCSAGIVTENGEFLGSLDMYCSVRRTPSPMEIQWIERAKCLAALAIKLEDEADRQSNSGPRANRLARGSVLQWPVSVN